jgi:hypothetical protein
MIFSTVCCAFFIGISLIPGVQRANPQPGAVSLVALQALWAGKYGSALAVGDGTADVDLDPPNPARFPVLNPLARLTGHLFS